MPWWRFALSEHSLVFSINENLLRIIHLQLNTSSESFACCYCMHMFVMVENMTDMWLCVTQGIISGSLGHWSGSGFTFHAWTCLEGKLTDIHVQSERPLYRYYVVF